MNNLQDEINAINEEFGLIEENGIVVTTSRHVAEVYGKNNKDVMKKIRYFIDLIPELDGRNFTLVDYIDDKKEKRPMYKMDRQGFSMLVNKFTGDKATIFTHKYTKAFEKMANLIDQLSEENNTLYDIAISEKGQLERQYAADKIKYAVRNIERLLSSAKYTELEDIIEKVIDVHIHLRKKDRYEYYKGLTTTEYKQKIINIIDNKLDTILLRKSDMLYHTVAQQLQKNLKDRYIKTSNRSTGQIISHKEKEIEQLKNTMSN